MKNVTLEFLCSECHSTTTWKQDVMLGDNTVDFTCTQCGEQWHMFFDVLSLDPLHIGTLMTKFIAKRTIGYLVDDTFFPKGKMQ